MRDYIAGGCIYNVYVVRDCAGKLHLVADRVVNFYHLGGHVLRLVGRYSRIVEGCLARGGVADIGAVVYYAASQRGYHKRAQNEHDEHLRYARAHSAAALLLTVKLSPGKVSAAASFAGLRTKVLSALIQAASPPSAKNMKNHVHYIYLQGRLSTKHLRQIDPSAIKMYNYKKFQFFVANMRN